MKGSAASIARRMLCIRVCLNGVPVVTIPDTSHIFSIVREAGYFYNNNIILLQALPSYQTTGNEPREMEVSPL